MSCEWLTIEQQRTEDLIDQAFDLLGSEEKALHHFAAAGTLIIADPQKDMVLLGNHQELNHKTGEIAYGWGNPAGSREDDETAWQTARRETREEFGLDLEKPSGEPLIMVAIHPDTLNTPSIPLTLKNLSIGVCYPILVNPVQLDPNRMRPTEEIKKFAWWSEEPIGDHTDDFVNFEELWGGTFTGMALLRWHIARWHETKQRFTTTVEFLEKFAGMIAFLKYDPRQWPSSYEDLKSLAPPLPRHL